MLWKPRVRTDAQTLNSGRPRPLAHTLYQHITQKNYLQHSTIILSFPKTHSTWVNKTRYVSVAPFLSHFQSIVFQWLCKSIERCQLWKVCISSKWEVFLEVQKDGVVSIFCPCGAQGSERKEGPKGQDTSPYAIRSHSRKRNLGWLKYCFSSCHTSAI